jgi:hypothetical protein
MTDTARIAELSLLAERCEAASGADREIDLAIATWCFEHGGKAGVNYEPALWLMRNDSFTASLDAAMTLVPAHALFMARTVWDGDKTAGIATISQYEDRKEGDQLRRYWLCEHQADAATPALALCAAALRAHIKDTHHVDEARKLGDAERARIVAWLRTLATAQLTPSILAFFGDPWGDDGQRLCGELADAIERLDHHKGDGE